MKTLSFFLLAVGIFSLSCTSIKNVGDRDNPQIQVHVVHGSGAGSTLVGHSNPNREPTALGCPEGTPEAGQHPLSYFMNLGAAPLELNVTSLDQGGVRDLTIILKPIRMSQIDTLYGFTDPNHAPIMTQTGPLEVTVRSHFSNVRTGQTVRLRVSGLNSVLNVRVHSTDFHTHTSTIPNVDLEVPQVQIMDLSECQ